MNQQMMLLTDLSLPSIIDTSSADMATEFYMPAPPPPFKMIGGWFFSSGWLRWSPRGNKIGRQWWTAGRMITGPILDANDWEALQLGDAAKRDSVLRNSLFQNIEKLIVELEQNTLSALAWMVADEILTFKLALPQNKLAGGDFHDKFGIYTDAEGNQVSFNGSPNESAKGFQNYESNKIFKSWEPGFAPFVDADVKRFERLWRNEDLNVRVFDLPEAAREKIIRLREGERPYPEPEWIKRNQIGEEKPGYQQAKPSIPSHIAMRPYQEEAIDAWFAHGCQGLFEMATGPVKRSLHWLPRLDCLKERNV
ncbi:MAG: hypothetical protein IPM76_10930 [Chloroflexi bacterium]|nr:hypothetical protein [Chloroflexota bacterium]